jgi:hypothetical protein
MQNQTTCMGADKEEDCTVFDETSISVVKSDKINRVV